MNKFALIGAVAAVILIAAAAFSSFALLEELSTSSEDIEHHSDRLNVSDRVIFLGSDEVLTITAIDEDRSITLSNNDTITVEEFDKYFRKMA